MVGLGAPSLWHLGAGLRGQSFCFFSISHLRKSICDIEWWFTAVNLGLSHSALKFFPGNPLMVNLLEYPFPGPSRWRRWARSSPGRLSTVEELVAWHSSNRGRQKSAFKRINDVVFVTMSGKVKMIRVPAKVGLDTAHFFQQDGQEHFLDLLPGLKRVEVPSAVGRDDLYAFICDAFKPLVATRQQAGRHMRLSWTF
ncbi:hypothetical protein BJY52DRAFT_1226433 [Lactarius psammicola]|nr:hypothetical protein BJY52DRAFT_1226433 [Lactarius psammicola]